MRKPFGAGDRSLKTSYTLCPTTGNVGKVVGVLGLKKRPGARADVAGDRVSSHRW
jgi:hypothetical protein